MAYGFFPAPGTNYTFGDESEIARRLDQLAKAHHLHIIGISGYRSPTHSVAVGGFANDPHTRGEASDSPGVESVPESVLNEYGLTRPFPGPAEADHIQLMKGGTAKTVANTEQSGTHIPGVSGCAPQMLGVFSVTLYGLYRLVNRRS